MKTDPISQLCEVAMERFAWAVMNARSGSPLDQARTKLGDRFSQVACDALRATLLRVLRDPEMKQSIRQASPGLPVGTVWMATVIADTTAAVIRTANEETA